jgi:hypothetical protein
LPASSRQPAPEFAFAFNDIEVPPDQLLGAVRAGYIPSLFRAALGRIGPPNPSAKNHLIGRSMEWVVTRAICRCSGLFEDAGGMFEDAGGIPACSRSVERQRHHR